MYFFKNFSTMYCILPFYCSIFAIKTNRTFSKNRNEYRKHKSTNEKGGT